MKSFILVLFAMSLAGCATLSGLSHRSDQPVEFYYHEVQNSGETLGDISEWYTGEFRNWTQILENNPGLLVHRIQIGDTIRIPSSLIVNSRRMPEQISASNQGINAGMESMIPLSSGHEILETDHVVSGEAEHDDGLDQALAPPPSLKVVNRRVREVGIGDRTHPSLPGERGEGFQNLVEEVVSEIEDDIAPDRASIRRASEAPLRSKEELWDELE